jgi:hypothetical protein
LATRDSHPAKHKPIHSQVSKQEPQYHIIAGYYLKCKLHGEPM